MREKTEPVDGGPRVDAAGSPAANWIEVRSEGGGFAIDLPNGYEGEPFDFGHGPDRYHAVHAQYSGTSFSASCFFESTPPERFDWYANASAKRLFTVHRVAQAGLDGDEVDQQIPGLNRKLERILYGPDRLCLLTVLSYNPTKFVDADAKRFLDSFRFLDGRSASR